MNPWLAAPMTGSAGLIASLSFAAATGVMGIRKIRARVSAIGHHPTAKAISDLTGVVETLSRAGERVAAIRGNVDALQNDIETLAAAYARGRLLLAEIRATIAAVRATVNL